MNTNESRIYGTLLILASLMVIALVVMGAPERERVKCEGYNLSFKIEEARDTFLIGERVTIVNETNDVSSLEWIVPEVDSIVVGKSMQEQSLVLVFTREGKKNIQLRINDRKDCTTVAKRIFIMPHCSDGLQNGSETDIDCGGNCPPCEGVAAITNTGNSTQPVPPPVWKPTCYDGRQNGAETGIDCGGNCPRTCKTNIGSLPRAYIVRISGELKCQTDIIFDCGIPPSYNPTWKFADNTGNHNFSGKRMTHKFLNEGIYNIRVYIGTTEVGQKQFNIGACLRGEPPTSPPPSPPLAKANIILPASLNCKEDLIFRSNSTQPGNRIRWQVNGIEKTGTNFYHTFKEAGTYTLKLYVGSNNSPDDTRTFTIKCDAPPPKPKPITPPVTSNISLYPILKERLQSISDEGAKIIGIPIKKGPKYQRILGDTDLCKAGNTKVRVNNEREKSLDEYFKDLINIHYIIDEVKVKKKDDCIELILITHHKR